MKRALSLVLATAWLIAGGALAGTYDYPFDDTFVATVVGTPEAYQPKLPTDVPFRQSEIKIFADRVTPDYLWYDDKLRYVYARQKGPAPLVFIIAGTGGAAHSSHSINMARAFYQAGMHVVTLSSPTHSNFVVSASATAVPGHAFKDAEDLYRVMEKVMEDQGDKVEVTDYYVTGYSLGGFNAAFVAWLDEQRQVFNFRKALLINPPVRLYSSISLLDRMLENIPGGVDNFQEFYDNVVHALSDLYKRSTAVQLNEDFIYQVYEALQLEDEQLAALVGLVFRISSANMMFASDVMTDYGFIKPKNLLLTRNSSPGVYQKVAHRVGFTDYFHAYFYPFYKRDNPSVTRTQMIDEMSLTTIEDYLRNAQKIAVMHNENDLILDPGEIDFFPRVFGDRAKIYPVGGHLGNMDYRDNVAHMVEVFTQ